MRYISEMETVIKKIVPYMLRKGYDIQEDISFEEPANSDIDERKGFIDILVHCGKPTPLFVIEAKRDGTSINKSHRKQALEYGKSRKCLFVSVTNGKNFELLNVTTKKELKFNGNSYNHLPAKNDLIKFVIPQLKRNLQLEDISVPTDKSLPYRPGLSLSKLNQLFNQCHNSIRHIEKNEENAFSDFSKILFLKLLEEKWDSEELVPPYSYKFHELAKEPNDQADRVKDAINSMIPTIRDRTPYGEVLADPIRLKQSATYSSIVKKLSSVYFLDCEYDTKGAAFEYFVRATLKGKKLGQYFTPRPLVKLMLELGKYKQIESSLMAGETFKVLDPACGTGGFLVYAMNMCINDIETKQKSGEIHSTLANTVIDKLKKDTFYGIDANEGVACSAKMNMIIAGDGHTNIRFADSLKEEKLIPDYEAKGHTINDGKAHLILTNPPFGTSEGESLDAKEIGKYEVNSKKGQSLFIQKMIMSTHKESRIVTVIDDGVLNIDSDSELRKHILKECRVEKVVSLPLETFKPNKINVKSSVLVLKKRDGIDEDLEDNYQIEFIKIDSLGYDGAGEDLRGFDINRLIKEISSKDVHELTSNEYYRGYYWTGFSVNSFEVINDLKCRLDVKYWDIDIVKKTEKMKAHPLSKTIKDINLIETRRGKSPDSSEYVSKSDGYALVVKAGTNISKTGTLNIEGDYIEEDYFREKYVNSNVLSEIILQDGDILLSSTGDGTLGKCCVYRNEDENGNVLPAILDSHTTLIRVDREHIYPEYLCDYLRKGFGSKQVERLYTGSTGLIEIQSGEVERIVISSLPPKEEQKVISQRLRKIEAETENSLKRLLDKLQEEEGIFYSTTLNKLE
jgi:type I restriction enzyme M protein